MDSYNELKTLWQEVKANVIEMRELDPDCNLISGAQSHKYKIEPTVSDKNILEFETNNGIELPESYRTYLQHFGSSGASDLNGTNDFVDNISLMDVSKTSKIRIFEDTQDIVNKDHPIASPDGLVEIAKGYNPVVPFLVLNGDARGYVYLWNFGDMVGGLGQYADWYSKWATDALTCLKQVKQMQQVHIGTNLTELQEIYPSLEVRIFETTKYAAFPNMRKFLDCAFHLNENDNVVHFYTHKDELFNSIRSNN